MSWQLLAKDNFQLLFSFREVVIKGERGTIREFIFHRAEERGMKMFSKKG